MFFTVTSSAVESSGLSVCRFMNPLCDAALCRSTPIHHTPDSYTKRELVGAGPLHLAYARPFGRLKAPLGLSLLRKRELLKTRHFRQGARKSEGNFGKKREGWTAPALLTRQQQPKSFIPTLKPSSSRFRPGLQNALAIRKKPCYNATIIESEIFRAGFDSLPVVQPTSRKA